jgi:uncharacterized membrane protein YqjE
MTVQSREHRASDASLNELVHQVTEQVSTLVRDELRLAQLEMTRKARRAGMGAGLLGGVGALGAFGGLCLVAAAVLALVGPLGAWQAALVVGGGLLVLAGIAGLAGLLLVRSAAPPAPTAAMASIKQDVNTIAHPRSNGTAA